MKLTLIKCIKWHYNIISEVSSMEPVVNHDGTTVKRRKGRITAVIGSMFSGKSCKTIFLIHLLILFLLRSTLIDYLEQHPQESVLAIKYAHDVRYSTDSIATHDKRFLKAVPCLTLMPLLKHYDMTKIRVVGIDEGQFFPDLIAFLLYVIGMGIDVMVAGLSGTYHRTPFPIIAALIPLAHCVMHKTAVCMNAQCSAEAPFTRRIAPESDKDQIGGADKYMAVCGDCYDLDVSLLISKITKE